MEFQFRVTGSYFGLSPRSLRRALRRQLQDKTADYELNCGAARPLEDTLRHILTEPRHAVVRRSMSDNNKQIHPNWLPPRSPSDRFAFEGRGDLVRGEVRAKAALPAGTLEYAPHVLIEV